MRRWAGLVIAVVLLPIAGILYAPAAHAALQPPGSCTYQAAAAAASLTPLTSTLAELQDSAGFASNITAPPSSCSFTITGTFVVIVESTPQASQTTQPCLIPNGPPIPGAGAECSAYGITRTGGLSMVMSFSGMITALNDGVKKAVACSASFDSTGLAWCYFDYPGTIETL